MKTQMTKILVPDQFKKEWQELMAEVLSEVIVANYNNIYAFEPYEDNGHTCFLFKEYDGETFVSELEQFESMAEEENKRRGEAFGNQILIPKYTVINYKGGLMGELREGGRYIAHHGLDSEGLRKYLSVR